MRILLQFPEGLKKDALKYAQKYESEGHEVFISSEPSYGACDIPVHEAGMLGCDKIIHYGHTKFCNVKGIDVEYVPVYADVDVKGVMKSAIQTLKEYTKIGIITNVSHLKQLDEIKDILKQNGKVPITAKGSLRCNNEAQILGCDVTALNRIKDKVECIIYFGGGTFHALAPGALEENMQLPILWVDPFSRQVRWITEDIRRVQRQRRIALMKAAEASTYGILVSTKVGQYAPKVASSLKRKLEKMGKKAVIIVGNTFDFTSLGNFTDIRYYCWCIINTACPRIVDDQNKIGIPIINADEFAQMLKLLNRK